MEAKLSRMPQLDVPGRLAARRLGWGKPINLGDIGRLVAYDKAPDAWKRGHERASELGCGAFPMITSKATPYRMTAAHSFGLDRMRRSWVSAIHLRRPAASSQVSSLAFGAK